MTRFILLILLIGCLFNLPANAQFIHDQSLKEDSHWADTDSVEKENVPIGFYMWKVNPTFGSVIKAEVDTMPHHFPQTALTDGITGRYNFLGNLGSPRMSRFFTEYMDNDGDFIFARPYDFFLTQPGDLLFTNTKSPVANLTYHSCGNKQNGEDRIRAYFATNVNKNTGLGFKLDYLYGRGYYEDQSTAHFNATLFGSHIGERYQVHAMYYANHLKNTENGGIENDDYVTKPESFPTKYGTADMPVQLGKTWNKMDVNTVFLTQRYNLGFKRFRDPDGNIVKTQKSKHLPSKLLAATDSLNADTASLIAAAADSTELPLVEEFVPVTSIIHTLRTDMNKRRFLSNLRANETTKHYFDDYFLPGDSTNDLTRHLLVENLLGLELREGFNSWVKTGMRLYAKHKFERYTLPDQLRRETDYKTNEFTVGAMLMKESGKFFHYNLLGEMTTTGTDWGEFNVEGSADFNIALRKDTLRITAGGFLKNEQPSFYFEHYHARNAWWDASLDKQFRTRIFGEIAYKDTRLGVNVESIQNYTYFAEKQTMQETLTEDGYALPLHSVGVRQSKKNIQLISATLNQDFHWGIFNWENELTYQVSSDKDVFPVPTFNGYTNVYLLFRIAKVLRTEIGVDLRYFTKYYAPAYSPIIGQFCTQDADHKVKVGNYPVINAYANFHLRNVRFYVMGTHVNYSSGSRTFLVPHNPLNRLVIRFGLSWTFYN